MKDLFISHASEDKDELVRPLAEKLKKAGVDVWYDEYCLNPGDSISASIDKGLIECNYGLIILSQDFLRKKWTEYELKSLLTKEIDRGNKIIPIWYKVTRDDILNRSLYLADKIALNASVGIEQLVFEIIRAVRPDIINSYALKNISRKLRNSGKRVKIDISKLNKGVIVHSQMPAYIMYASKIIDSAFPKVSTHQDIVENFARDYDYDDEFLMWCVITSAYLDVIYAIGHLPDEKEMHEMLGSLIGLSLGISSWMEEASISENIKLQLENAYIKNAEALFTIKNHQEQLHDQL